MLFRSYIYPIKSCAPQSIHRWPLTPYSLLYDREWMIIDQHLNPLTLKRLPLLSQIRPTVNLQENQLILHATDHQPFVLDFDQGKMIR